MTQKKFNYNKSVSRFRTTELMIHHLSIKLKLKSDIWSLRIHDKSVRKALRFILNEIKTNNHA